MIELKFRAWRNGALEMLFEENEGDVFKWLGEGQDIEIMQFTGLKDKNGKEIYEGDIVRYRLCGLNPEDGETEYTEVVEFIDGGFSCELTPLYALADWGAEVIGNIHENPDSNETAQSKARR